MKDERWYWPIRLLKSLARLPINCDSWLGHGHTVENREPFAENTKLCTATLIDPHTGRRGLHSAGRRGGQLLSGHSSFYADRWTINWNMTLTLC